MAQGYVDIGDENDLLSFWSNNPDLPHDYRNGIQTTGQCLKCKVRPLREIYAFAGLPSCPLYFYKDIADELTTDKTPRIIPVRLLNYLVRTSDFSEQHVAHVAHIDVPGIVAMGAINLGGKPTLFTVLIDGTHRAVACLRAGREFKAHILTARETMICAEMTREQMGEQVLIDPTPERPLRSFGQEAA
jgi:hypothetical protein